MSLIKVKDNPHLARDEYSKAIINTDTRGYESYMNTRERMKRQQELLLNNTQEIQSLKEDVSEIKNLLEQLVIKLQGRE